MKQLIMNAPRWLVPVLLSGLVLIGCGGDTDFDSSSFKVGGTVSGLNSATSVQLTYGDSGNTVTVDQNGAFQFPNALAFNTGYAVAVATQPANQTCTVTNASGTARGVVSNIAVNCVTNGYTIGGTASGLISGAQLILSNNGTESLTVSANSSFTFATPVLSSYSVTVASTSGLPAGAYCSVSRGSGTPSANVTSVLVSCTTAVSNPSCGTGQALVGFNGASGAIIDRIAVRCADVVSGVVDTANASDGAFVGGPGGGPFAPFTCPAGEWVTSISGTNGGGGYPTALSSLTVTCSGSSTGTRSGSSVSGSAFAYSCTAPKKATGFDIAPTVIGGNDFAGFMTRLACEP
jgi:hypothetical protein